MLLLEVLRKRSVLPPFPFPVKHLTTTTTTPEAPSLTLHFLENSCKVPPEQSQLLSKRIHLKSTKKAHAILSLLKSHSFSPSNISSLVLRIPKLLLSDPVKTVSPKLSFFVHSLQIPPSFLVSHPSLLLSSLPNRILPNLSLFQSLLPPGFPPRDILLTYPSSFICDPSSILPRIHTLQILGVPPNVLLKLLSTPRLHDEEEEEQLIVMLKEKFFIDPLDSIFVHAYAVLAKLRREDWDVKVGFLKGLGWDEELVVSAFKKHPYFMTASMEKLGRNMGVFKEGFRWDVEYVAKYPVLLSLSYEKRIMPRLRVMRVLIEEGLFQGKIAARQLVLGKEEFWRRYVEKFKESVPRLVDAVQGF